MKRDETIVTQLIVALDVDTFKEAKKIVDKIYPDAKIFKVGSQLFTACGPRIVEYLNKKKAKIFLDLKFHDIPNTVASAVLAAARLGVYMLTLHAQGGREMMRAAVKALRVFKKSTGQSVPKMVGVTVLTSQVRTDAKQAVAHLARLAKGCGLDGVVCSVQECGLVRRKMGKDFLIVTPGIRPSGEAAQDQKRIATPRQAARAGSNFIVVGRPVVKAKSPAQAARDIIEELAS